MAKAKKKSKLKWEKVLTALSLVGGAIVIYQFVQQQGAQNADTECEAAIDVLIEQLRANPGTVITPEGGEGVCIAKAVKDGRLRRVAGSLALP